MVGSTCLLPQPLPERAEVLTAKITAIESARGVWEQHLAGVVVSTKGNKRSTRFLF